MLALAMLWPVVPGVPAAATNAPAARTLTSPYMRATNIAPGVVELQVALRKFTAVSNSAPAIWLAAVAHIGETNYYQALQKHLDAQGLVLFEGIRPPGVTNFSGAELAAGRKHTPAADGDRGTLQSDLAKALGLVFQLDAVDYDRRHFHNSDLSVAEITELMRKLDLEEPAADGAKNSGENASFKQLLDLMQGDSWMGRIARMALKLVAVNPKFQAVVKLTLIETLGRLEGDVANLQGLPADLRTLLKVLIHSRNQKVITDLAGAIRDGKTTGDITVFYGAGHMDDLELRLRLNLKYQVAGEIWLPAFRVNLKESGVNELEARMIRVLIQQQMDDLLPARKAE